MNKNCRQYYFILLYFFTHGYFLYLNKFFILILDQPYPSTQNNRPPTVKEIRTAMTARKERTAITEDGQRTQVVAGVSPQEYQL